MKLDRRLGMLLLAIWLIVTGLLPLVSISLGNLGLLLELIAIAAGLLILFAEGKLTKNLGWQLLGLWLVLIGLIPVLGISVGNLGLLLDLLAIAAGVVLLLERGRLTTNLTMLVLGVFLVATGALPLLKISLPSEGLLLSLLALAAGVLILLRQT